ncbi:MULTISPECIES: hypothetical protein [unclassified Lentilitoribacter]|jgi:hypothetical protein|uniref:hypothetical protein n=1 Tax=unclassified Lentilitoribacter TaxID=2647570 RepID=UPI0013A69E81|nr:hypothetical protein [Lentilitoribacter sp. Alg239-R112]
MTLNLAKHAFLSSSVLLSLTYSSFALDADKFSENLKAVFATSGAGIEYSSIKADGDNILLENVKMTSAAETFPIGSLQFNGVTELDDGSIRVEKTVVDDINHQEKDIKFTLVDFEIEGLRLPAADAEASPYLIYERATTGQATFTHKGVDVFKMASSDAHVDMTDDLQAMKFDGSANGIVIDLSAVEDPKAKQAIADMGYETLRGDIQIKGDWDAKTGRFNMPEYALTLNDAGRINIALDISGYTLEFIKQLQDVQKEMADQSDPKAQQAAGMASLALLQQLTLNALSIRFDDASITEKALKYAGSKQGMSQEQMAEAAKALLPFGLARLGMPELQQQITAAASAFLDNPQNIEIKATPPAPVPFGQIMGAAMADPRTIPATIGVEVVANQ